MERSSKGVAVVETLKRIKMCYILISSTPSPEYHGCEGV
jgi:hypothetical protein